MTETKRSELFFQFEGTTYPVRVTPEEEQRINTDPDYAYAVCINDEAEVKNGVGVNGEVEEMIWTDAATYLLLEEYRKRKELFRNPKIKKKELWMQIKSTFENHSYLYVTPDGLDKKFRNLKQTYLRINDSQNVKKRTGRGSIRWKFYDIMQEIFHVDENVTTPAVPIESAAQKSYKVRAPVFIPTGSAILSSVSKPQMTSPCTPVALRADHGGADLPSTSLDKASVHTNITTTSNDGAKMKKRARKNLLTYRSELIKTEKDRVAAIKDLKESIDENTNIMKTIVEIQRERNQILQQLINK